MPINDKDAVQAQLERMLATTRFKRKSRLSPLFRYLVEQTLAGKADGLKERTIAMDVFQKGTDFVGGDEDTTIRSSMNGLRAAIAEYYENEGLSDPVLVQLLPGIYSPTFEYRSAPAPITGLPATPPTIDISMPTRYIIQFECDDVEAILGKESIFRRISADPTFRNVQLRLGSIMLEFHCSSEGHDRLVTAWKSGELGEAVGFHVTSILPAKQVFEKLQKNNSKALESCFTPIIGLREHQSIVRVNVRCGIGLGLSVNHLDNVSISVTILTSSDGIVWRFNNTDKIPLMNITLVDDYSPWKPNWVFQDPHWNTAKFALRTEDSLFIRAELRLVHRIDPEPNNTSIVSLLSDFDPENLNFTAFFPSPTIDTTDAALCLPKQISSDKN